MPLVVLEELDRHKNQGKPVLRDRAAGVARRIEDLVEEHGGRGDDSLSGVLALEPDGHVRRPTVDAEIVAVAAALVAEPARRWSWSPTGTWRATAGQARSTGARPQPPCSLHTAGPRWPGSPTCPVGRRSDIG